jgi:hypothetical protein
MNRSTAGGIAFIAVGVAFIALGSSGQRAFLPIGVAFALIGLPRLQRAASAGPLSPLSRGPLGSW